MLKCWQILFISLVTVSVIAQDATQKTSNGKAAAIDAGTQVANGAPTAVKSDDVVSSNGKADAIKAGEQISTNGKAAAIEAGEQVANGAPTAVKSEDVVSSNGKPAEENSASSRGKSKADLINKSASAKGLPSWAVPGVIQALQSVYSSLNSATQDRVKQVVDDSSLNIDKMVRKLGSLVDGLSTSQKDKIRQLIIDTEYERRDIGSEIFEHSKLSDEAKEVLRGMIEPLDNIDSSLTDLCNNAKNLAGSVSEETLKSIGVPKSVSTVNCQKLSSVFFS